MTQKFRNSIEKQQTGLPVHEKVNLKVNMLHNALLVSNWINSFDPDNVNDCFNEEMNANPP